MCKPVSPVPLLSCFLVCAKVGGAFFGVCLVWISAVAAFEGGVKALFALGRAVRLAAGMRVGWLSVAQHNDCSGCHLPTWRCGVQRLNSCCIECPVKSRDIPER